MTVRALLVDLAVAVVLASLAIALGVVAGEASGSLAAALAVAIAVTAAGAVPARRLRERAGLPDPDTHEAALRGSPMSGAWLQIAWVTGAGAWIIVAAGVLDDATFAIPPSGAAGANELLPVASAFPLGGPWQRALARRGLRRAAARDDAVARAVVERVGGDVIRAADLRDGGPPEPAAAPRPVTRVDGLPWRRGRLVAYVLAFGLVGALGVLALLTVDGSGRHVVGWPLVATGFGIAVPTARRLRTPFALAIDVRGLDPLGWGPVPWEALEGVHVGRGPGGETLYLHVPDEPGDWPTRAHRRLLKRTPGLMPVPLLLVDGDAADVVAALRALRPDLRVLVD